MYSDQLYRRKGPFSGSSPDSIIGLSSYRGCLTGSSLVPTTTCTSDEEEPPPPEPQPASTPPATAAPAISLSASRREIFGRHIGLCFGWNTIFTPLPLGGELPPLPDLLYIFPLLQRSRFQAQFSRRGVEAHLVHHLAVHRRVREQQ